MWFLHCHHQAFVSDVKVSAGAHIVWVHGECNTNLVKVVDHEEDVGVAHLGLLPFAVHGVLAGRGKHLLLRGTARERGNILSLFFAPF